MDEKKLSQFWGERVPSQWKHYIGTEFDVKIEKYARDIQENLVQHIDFSIIKTALDWGCGGGFCAKFLSEYCDIVCLDITRRSLKECRNYLKKHNKKIKKEILLKSLEDFYINLELDLIFSASVIQHFPSIEYWNSVVEIWKKINPKMLAIQTRHGDENKDNENEYFNDTKNYLLALYLTTEEVLSNFSDRYDLVYHKLDDDNYSMYEYFVFRNKCY